MESLTNEPNLDGARRNSVPKLMANASTSAATRYGYEGLLFRTYLFDIPNTVTILGMMSSVIACWMVVIGDLVRTSQLVMFSIVLDNVDGFAARTLRPGDKVMGRFGLITDCYADFVTKAVFVCLLIYRVVWHGQSHPIAFPIMYIHLSAISYRYAREQTLPENMSTTGLSPDYGTFGIALMCRIFSSHHHLLAWAVGTIVLLIDFLGTRHCHFHIPDFLTTAILAMAAILVIV